MVDGDGPTLVSRFLTAGQQDPDAVAVVAAGRRTTYRTLVASVLSTAHRLRAAGVANEAPVGVLARRDVHFVVGALAAMAAGGCFVPLDPASPEQRQADLAARAGVRVGVGKRVALPYLDVVVEPEFVDHPFDGEPQVLSADALAYELFTSGSTGEPKIVPIEQRSVCALLDGFAAVAPAAGRVVSMSVCPFSFDVSMWELFIALTTGGTVVILDEDAARDPERLVEAVHAEQVTTAYLPPVMLEPVADQFARHSGLGRLRRVLTGVEPIPNRVMRPFLDFSDELVVINGYGPTEATICSTFYRVTRDGDPERRVPIGSPVAGWTVDVVDGDLRPVAVGVVGEIVMGGVGLARGYVGDGELTAARFVVFTTRCDRLSTVTADCAPCSGTTPTAAGASRSCRPLGLGSSTSPTCPSGSSARNSGHERLRRRADGLT